MNRVCVRLLGFIRVAGVALFFVSTARGAATVNYQGFVFNLGGLPVINGFATAGTFAPGFDPYTYDCHYEDVPLCNLTHTHYSQAVNEGNFFPIGPGSLTDGSGFFSGTGMTTAVPGTPIFLFVFSTANPDLAKTWGLATSSNTSYLVPGGGVTTVSSAQANQFIAGSLYHGGIELSILPIPEPTSAVMTIILILGLPIRLRKRASPSLLRRQAT